MRSSPDRQCGALRFTHPNSSRGARPISSLLDSAGLIADNRIALSSASNIEFGVFYSLGHIRVELRQFRYFVAVAEELHFSRAAERLHIGQPPLSLQIQAIERELGVTLFNRNRRKVELTDAGKLFLVEARAALAQAAYAVETAKRAARGEVGNLRISFTTSAPLTSVFTRTVREFRELQPAVHLDLRIQISQSILDDLLLGNIDVGLIRPAASHPIPAGISAFPVVQDRLLLVLPANHALTRWKGRIPIKALEGERFVLRQRGSGAGFYEQVLQICARAGFAPNVVQEATEPPTILGMVATGIGVTIAPALLQAIHVEDIVWRELDLGQEAVSAILLVMNTQQKNSLRDQFVDIVKRNIVPEKVVTLAARTDAPKARSGKPSTGAVRLTRNVAGLSARTRL
jgi:DNA-binding transcriptional LysR family regulator